MDLTTSARVKLAMQPTKEMGTSIDSTLSQLITNVSRRVENYCDRAFEWKARTEDFDVNDGNIYYPLRAFPARTVAEAFTAVASVSVYNDLTRTFSTTLDSALYAIDNRRGYLIFDNYTPLSGPQVLRVTYTGGLNSSVTSAATFVSAFPDIAEVVEMEVIRAFYMSQQPHATAVSLGGVNVAIVSDSGFLPTTKQTLEKYRRPAVG